MIPYELLSKMGHYQVEVCGAKVKVSVVTDDARLIDEKIAELWPLLQRRVMGLELKMTRHGCPAMLVLCVEGHCLIIAKLGRLFSYYPKDASKSALGRLLSDRTICFVNPHRNCTSFYDYPELSNMINGTSVALGHLAGRILKKSELENCGLAELASEVGIDIKPLGSSGACPENWVDKVIFSEEEIKDVVHNVYGSYLVGNKLLGML